MSEFFLLAFVHFLAVASPGPDFALVVKESVSSGRKQGILVSAGIALGLTMHIAYTLLGLGVIISQSIVIYTIIKTLCACYLIWIGVKGIMTKKTLNAETLGTSTKMAAESPAKTNWLSLLSLGFFTNVLNPKVTLFFLAIFTTIVSPQTTVQVKLLYGLWMVFVNFVYFSLITVLFSTSIVRTTFSRLGHWFDRITGAVLVGLGLKVAFSK